MTEDFLFEPGSKLMKKAAQVPRQDGFGRRAGWTRAQLVDSILAFEQRKIPPPVDRDMFMAFVNDEELESYASTLLADDKLVNSPLILTEDTTPASHAEQILAKFRGNTHHLKLKNYWDLEGLRGLNSKDLLVLLGLTIALGSTSGVVVYLVMSLARHT